MPVTASGGGSSPWVLPGDLRSDFFGPRNNSRQRNASGIQGVGTQGHALTSHWGSSCPTLEICSHQIVGQEKSPSGGFLRIQKSDAWEDKDLLVQIHTSLKTLMGVTFRVTVDGYQIILFSFLVFSLLWQLPTALHKSNREDPRKE